MQSPTASADDTHALGVLAPQHAELIAASAISADVAAARGYRTITTKAELRRLGFSERQASAPALLLPVHDVASETPFYQIRPDQPRIADGKALKYETPRGTRMVVDVPPASRPMLGDPKVPVFITEGIRKADAGASAGLCAIDLIGVWNWRGTNPEGGKTLLADFESIALNGRDVYICYDSDVMTKAAVRLACERLAAVLENREAHVRYVLLPALPDGKKQGLDDFLASGATVDDLLHLASRELPLPKPDDAETRAPYIERAGGLMWRKPTQDGHVETPLANFTARIVADVIEDDGMEARRVWEVEARRQGRVARVTLTPGQFAVMTWPGEALGAGATVEPGFGAKDRARHAIQVLSGDPAERRVFTHTGWRQVDGTWCYLHAGGALGPAGPVALVETSLSGPALAYLLPEPTKGEACRDGVRESLSILNLAPDHVTVPVLGAVYRALFGPLDSSIWLAGPTGGGKSEIAALAQQHFGATMDARQLPESWISTAMEGTAFMLKDALLVIDDFAPDGSMYDVQRLHATAGAVIRRQGNRQGRARMRADTSLRRAKPPRGALLGTGEDIPRGQSVRARMVIVELSHGDLAWGQLTTLQAIAAEGQLAGAMAGYIQWIAGRYDDLAAARPDDITTLRNEGRQSVAHRRTPDAVAQLAYGWRTWLAFALDVGAITEGERATLWDRVWAALGQVASAQVEHQAATEPVRRFAELLASGIASGRAHLAYPDGTSERRGAERARWGWRQTTGGTGAYAREEWRPQGDRVGWVDGDTLYLDPDAAFAAAQRLGQATGDGLTIGPRTLWRRMAERGVLQARSTERFTMQKRGLDGAQRRVLVVGASYLSGTGPSGPSGSDSAPASRPLAAAKPQGGASRPSDERPAASPVAPRQGEPPTRGAGEAAGASGGGRDTEPIDGVDVHVSHTVGEAIEEEELVL